jgi:hypothetical protein
MGKIRQSHSAPVIHIATIVVPMVLIHSTGREISIRRKSTSSA